VKKRNMQVDKFLGLVLPPITGIGIYLLTIPRTMDTLLVAIIWTVFWWFVFAVGAALEDLP